MARQFYADSNSFPFFDIIPKFFDITFLSYKNPKKVGAPFGKKNSITLNSVIVCKVAVRDPKHSPKREILIFLPQLLTQ